MNKEYTYNIDKYTIGVDENGKDEIGLTIAIIKNGKINVLGNYYGENARCIDLLIKENQELKQKYENAVADYETIMAEKEQLKKQVEEWENHLKCSKEMLDIQGQKGNYDYDEYMLGLYNGMEYIIALFETREPNYISGKDVKFTNNKTQQKEFIKWLEDYLKLFDNMCIDEQGYYDMLEEILQKYKEIIGVSDENNIK
jgi:hypothetical protein